MVFEKAKLLQILNTIKPVIPKKEGADDMVKKVAFTGTDIAAQNENMAIVWPFETDFVGVVPSEELMAILQKVSAAEVDITMQNDGNLRITAGKSRFKLKTDPNAQFIEDLRAGLLTEINNVNWYLAPGNFMEAIKFCMYSASKDTTQRHLACVHVKDTQVVASDDFRISRFVMDAPFAGEVLLLANPVCVQMTKFRFTQYSIDSPTWSMFLTEDNVLLASRKIDEHYDDVDQFMQFNGTEYELPEALAKEVDTVAIMAAGQYDIEKEIVVTLGAGKVHMTASKDIGKAETTVAQAKLNPAQPVSFKINPFFFSEVLRMAENTIKLGDNKAVFIKNNFTHLISLTVLPPTQV